jgi:hypothetical protein
VSLAADITRRQTAMRLRRLGFGFGLAAALLALCELISFMLHLDGYPRLGFSVLAWALLIAGMVIIYALHGRYPDILPPWALPTVLALWTATVVFDMVGSWAPGDAAATPVASIAVGAGLLQIATHAQSRTLVVSASLLGVVIAVAFAVHGLDEPLSLALAYLMVGLAVAPTILAMFVVRSLGVAAQLELDRAQVQSTIMSPGFTVGMLASEELARLDLDAERLLEGVATGRTALPLDAETAAAAASIATELRLHLIEGRRETWLYHAVSESAFLGPAVTVSDPDGLAGLLGPDQRDGLLSAVWLLLSDPPRPGQGLNIVMRRGERGAGDTPHDGLAVPIAISATGVPRKGVDPATWHAVGKVGRYVESTREGTLHIDIECVVGNPVDYESEQPAPHANRTEGRT